MTAAEVIALIKSQRKTYHCYVLSNPDGEPFYVGVGKRSNNRTYRILDHEKQARSPKRSGAKVEFIRNLWATGAEISYSISAFFDTRKEADVEERRLIALHGRRDRCTGSLVNKTAGGQGFDDIDYVFTPARVESAKRVGLLLRGRTHSEEEKAKRGAALRGRRRSPESRAKMSLAHKGQKPSDETRAKMSAVHKARAERGEIADFVAAGTQWQRDHRDHVATRQRERLADPAFAEKWRANLRAAVRSPEVRAARTQIMKERWQDPEYRAKHLEVVRRPRRRRKPRRSDSPHQGEFSFD